jgi:hypothetical protein
VFRELGETEFLWRAVEQNQASVMFTIQLRTQQRQNGLSTCLANAADAVTFANRAIGRNERPRNVVANKLRES